MKYSEKLGYSWVGFIVGAAAATFIAPRSGAETRKYCQTKAREAADSLTRQTEEMRNRAMSTIEHGREALWRRFRQCSAVVDAGKRALSESPLIQM